MKTTEMNARERKAFYNVKHAADELLGGLENTLCDSEPESEEYKKANDLLNDHDKLVTTLYEMATTAIYQTGMTCFNKETCKKELRDINFCGREWIMERCEKRITKEGY